ncbi:ROK family protein [Microbacterium sp. 4R-513]|uniref:ROK family protein n=1 Tax=Microbacterium sp. 4R-513 TaxID=2567934 RepID=UPI0013E15311|nr:ROK family protein [Microbacterium sp. 4R-513]QIG38647.1 ROK family protein [Microbacterium sp. 4R-513]
MNDPVGSRQANLSRLLRLAHLEGPLSRATLTAATGLNRSTIGDLVGDLVGLGLVEERAPDPSRRVGRPSPLVTAHPRVVAIAVNPEVDALTIGAVGLDRTVRLSERIEMTGLIGPERTAELIAERLAAWRDGELADAAIAGIGVAVPGLVRASDGLVRDAPHLKWTEVALRDLIEAATGLPTVIGNDASMGIVAEHLFGAARGIDDVVYLNGGASGIGGGLIVQGMAISGASGYSGEFGQNRPGIASPADRRAGNGVLEDEVSRSRLLAALHRGNVDEPTLAQLLKEERTPDVLDEVARQRRILATALANAVNVLNPSVVVLGGFLAMLAEHDLEGFTRAVVGQSMPANGEDLDIRPAALAQDRLLIGAAEAAFDELLRDPAGTALR